jgi:hypothetical protein
MIGLNPTGGVAEPWPADMTHVRIWDQGAHWGAIHTAPGVYNWTLLDQLVAKADGRHVTYVIGGTPRWLAKYPDQAHFAPWLGPGSNSMPYNLDVANQFAWHLATRYAGRIHAYEVWNEPQLADFLHPWTPAERSTLARMTKRLHRTIKGCDRQAMVLAASVLPRASSGGMTRARKYLDALRGQGWPVDGFTCHIYPEIGFGAVRWERMLTDVAAHLRSMNPPTLRLWVTETAFGLLGPVTDPAGDEAMVRELYERDRGRFVFWYAPNRPDLGGMQIVTTPGAESAAWRAIQAHHDA